MFDILFCIGLLIAFSNTAVKCDDARAVPAGTAEQAVLSISTDDGLVVIHGPRDVIAGVKKDIGANLAPGATNMELLRLLNSSDKYKSLGVESYLSLPENWGRVSEQKRHETTVHEALEQGKIPAIEGKELYEAYMLFHMRGEKMMLLDQAPPDAVRLEHTVFVFSSCWGAGQSGIFVDGGNVSPNKNGYNLVALDPAGEKVVSSGGFETYSDTSSGPRMQNFLDTLPKDSYVLAAIIDGPGVLLTGGAVRALHSYGSTTEPNPQIRSSHAMIGRKGMQPGSAIEDYRVNQPTHIAVFDGRLYVPSDKLEQVMAATGEKIVAISGTGPNDKVVIIGQVY